MFSRLPCYVFPWTPHSFCKSFRFAREQVDQIDQNRQWSRALDGSDYLPGMVYSGDFLSYYVVLNFNPNALFMHSETWALFCYFLSEMYVGGVK